MVRARNCLPTRSLPLATLALLLLSSCFGAITVPPEAQVTCAADDDCPSALVCAGGLCADPSGPCFVQGTRDAVGDGTACDAPDADADDADALHHCVAGRCVVPFCGDGVLRFDDGEACDPGVAGTIGFDPVCRADCTQPFCGDGILDVGESCERGDDDCAACSLTCGAGVASCDVDGTACDCFTNRLLEGDFIPLSGGISEDTVWIVRSPPDDEFYRLASMPLTGGAIDNFGELEFGEFAHAPDGTLYGSLWDREGHSRLIEFHGEEQVEILDLTGAERVSAFAGFDITDDAIIGSGLNGLVRWDRAALTPTALSDACVQKPNVVVCGDVVACADFQATQIDVVALEGGAASTLATTDIAMTFGCSATYGLVWYDGAILWQRAPDGEPIALLSFITSPERIAFQARVVEVAGELWFSGGLESLQTYRAQPQTRSVAGVAAGWLYDVSGDDVLITFIDSENSGTIETFTRTP